MASSSTRAAVQVEPGLRFKHKKWSGIFRVTSCALGQIYFREELPEDMLGKYTAVSFEEFRDNHFASQVKA